MAEGTLLRTLVSVALVASAAATLVTGTHEFSKDRIAANQRARLLRSLNSVLDPAITERDVNPVPVSAYDPALLGSREPIDAFVVLDDGRPVAAILASIAPDGYNAAIQLLVGIGTDGRVMGVRVIQHRETPGLGDAIDVAKSNWIRQFDRKSLDDPALPLWAVRPDEGVFDSITGATVTPRAVVKAVKNTLVYFAAHHDELFAAAERAAVEEAAGDD